MLQWPIHGRSFSASSRTSPANPNPRARYEEIFTSSGQGRWSVPDYFRDMSHGALDLSGSKVFGWYTLDQATTDYKGHGGNPQGRQELIDWARAKATADGVDLAKFHSVVVVLNTDADLFGGATGAVCGDNGGRQAETGLSVSYLGQEMGHVYGLNHSRQEGEGDYTDPFDVMSVASARWADHPVYAERTVREGNAVFRIGPGLNAANMQAMGWLDPARVVTVTANGSGWQVVNLRPLHRRDLPGPLAIRFGDWFVEFRGGKDWDRGFRAGVQVRRLEDGISHIQPSWAGALNAQAGDSFGTPEGMEVLGAFQRLHVSAIDAANDMATVAVAWREAELPVPHDPFDRPFREPWIAWSLGRDKDAIVIVDGVAARVEADAAKADLRRIAEEAMRVPIG